jgi:hypothetical protein
MIIIMIIIMIITPEIWYTVANPMPKSYHLGLVFATQKNVDFGDG